MRNQILNLCVLAAMALTTAFITSLLQMQPTQAATVQTYEQTFQKAPPVITGENIYIAWWTNKTGSYEVMFRASTDNGATFGEKINLSNTTSIESVDAEIAAEGDNVVVTWWERNSTNNEPVARISNNAGQTFGPLQQLSQNGTIGSGEDQ
jgi:hypothetical protein